MINKIIFIILTILSPQLLARDALFDKIHYNSDYSRSNMSEAEFLDTIDDVIKIYRPIAEAFETPKSHYNVHLFVYPEWTNDEVNAYADRNDSWWYIWIKGGLGRHNTITRLGLIAVVCHELGHLLGGYPFKYAPADWASAEGQADYFAAHVCMKKVFAQTLGKYSAPETKYCSGLIDPDRTVCNLTLTASQSDANLLAEYWIPRKPVFYDTPETKTVDYTILQYPTPQCRMDTLFAATFCYMPWNDNLIPWDQYSTCTRPRCWFYN